MCVFFLGPDTVITVSHNQTSHLTPFKCMAAFPWNTFDSKLSLPDRRAAPIKLLRRSTRSNPPKFSVADQTNSLRTFPLSRSPRIAKMKVTVPAILALAALVASASACDHCESCDLCELYKGTCDAACFVTPWNLQVCQGGCVVIFDRCVKKWCYDTPTVRGGKVDALQSHKKNVKGHFAKIL
jgi:hypothetical protein